MDALTSLWGVLRAHACVRAYVSDASVAFGSGVVMCVSQRCFSCGVGLMCLGSPGWWTVHGILVTGPLFREKPRAFVSEDLEVAIFCRVDDGEDYALKGASKF